MINKFKHGQLDSLPNERILSVDVLRGFDMFWLIGGTGLALSIVKIFGQGIQGVLLPQLDHAEWVGFTFYDLIFPLFEFVMGMSVVFSLSRILKQKGRHAAFRRLVRRSILLFLLGLIYYGGLSNGLHEVRVFGVLQRLAVTYFITGLLFIHFNFRTIIIISVLVLISYWILNVFIPVPDTGIISITKESNWAQYIDSALLPGRKLGGDGSWDVNGILSTLPATVNCLFGVFASFILLNKKFNPMKKVYYLVWLGLFIVIIGLGWSISFPIIKKIWSSSYVLIAGGLSFILMGIFYWIIDVKKYTKWTLILVWIGVNPITIYMARKLIDFNGISTRFVGGTTDLHSTDVWGYLVAMIMSLALSMLLLRFLYNRKIFLKV